jgi:hypothetical protein
VLVRGVGFCMIWVRRMTLMRRRMRFEAAGGLHGTGVLME